MSACDRPLPEQGRQRPTAADAALRGALNRSCSDALSSSTSSSLCRYLNDVEEGGETTFPNLPVEDNGPEFSECARRVSEPATVVPGPRSACSHASACLPAPLPSRGLLPAWSALHSRPRHAQVLAVKPRKGDAVLFHSIKPTGELERRSLHSAWCAPRVLGPLALRLWPWLACRACSI